MAYAYPQCDTVDFEAMHKIALKQFMRIVAHGRHLGQHLSQRHCAQFVFSTPPEPEPEVPPRFCHCGEEPCPHQHHVHADMPGLVEEDDGTYTTIRQFRRSVEEVEVDAPTTPAELRHALRVFIGDLNGEDWQTAVLPAVVFRAHTIRLNWHGREGQFVVCREGDGE